MRMYEVDTGAQRERNQGIKCCVIKIGRNCSMVNKCSIEKYDCMITSIIN